jgi:hypothetical protein
MARVDLRGLRFQPAAPSVASCAPNGMVASALRGGTVTSSAQSGGRTALAVGLGLVALALVGLCVVPVAVWQAIGLLGREVPPPITPLGDPSIPGAGEGGPHMPISADLVSAAPIADTKVIWLEVVTAEHTRWAAVGDRCRLDVTYDPAALGPACHAIVRCGETAVYGDELHGFYECVASLTAPDVRIGSDGEATLDDGDPSLLVTADTIEVLDGVDGALGAFTLVLSRTTPPPAPEIIAIEPIFYPEGMPIPGAVP